MGHAVCYLPCTEGTCAYLLGIVYTCIMVQGYDILSSVSVSGTEAYFPNRYTGIFSPMRELMDNVNCTGTESKLSDCSHSIILQDSYASPRVQCQHGELDHI